MTEHRSALAKTTYKAGLTAERLPGRDCVIRNLSPTEVCLGIERALVPLNGFNLILKPENLFLDGAK